jgi:hypothetical protein
MCSTPIYQQVSIYNVKNVLKIEHSITFICFKQQFAAKMLVHTAVKQIQLQT